MARPKLPSGKKRTKQVMLALTPAELRTLKHKCGGVPLARWAREELLKKLSAIPADAVSSAQGVSE